MKRKIRMGMIGGGQGAFIGAVHRIAANMDGLIELVCGCFSSNPENSKQTGASLFLNPERVYSSYQEMIAREKALPDGERMDFVAIVTPNHVHFEPAKMALENGFHVVVEKPMTFSLEEAKALQSCVEQTGNLLCLTHTYSGYPMVKQARALVSKGTLGKIRKVVVQYPQGWLSRFSESDGNKQASWRTNPNTSGKSGAMGDIGTHAAHLAEYITGLRITEICADLNTFVDGRLLDDDGNVLLKFENGAKGVLIASQISAGEENALQIAIYGEEAGLTWKQEDPNNLVIKPLDQPKYVLRTGNAYQGSYALDELAVHNTRLPSGHPEGMIEAFANIYRNFALGIHAKMENRIPNKLESDYPNVDDGVRGMAFIDAVVTSAESNQKWYRLPQ